MLPRYYQKNKEKLQERLVKGIRIIMKKKKTKGVKMLMKKIEIFSKKRKTEATIWSRTIQKLF